MGIAPNFWPRNFCVVVGARTPLPKFLGQRYKNPFTRNQPIQYKAENAF